MDITNFLKNVDLQYERVNKGKNNFIKDNPGVADLLDVNFLDAEDPHVTSLIDLNDFSAVRAQIFAQKVGEQFKSDLKSLYFPSFNNNIPSMSLMHFNSYNGPMFIHKCSEFKSNCSKSFHLTPLKKVALDAWSIESVEHRVVRSEANKLFASEITLNISKNGRHINDNIIIWCVGDDLQASIIWEAFVFGVKKVVWTINGKSIETLGNSSISLEKIELNDRAQYWESKRALPDHLLIDLFTFPQKYLTFKLNIPLEFFKKKNKSNKIEAKLLFSKEYKALEYYLPHVKLHTNLVPVVNIKKSYSKPVVYDPSFTFVPISSYFRENEITSQVLKIEKVYASIANNIIDIPHVSSGASSLFWVEATPDLKHNENIMYIHIIDSNTQLGTVKEDVVIHSDIWISNGKIPLSQSDHYIKNLTFSDKLTNIKGKLLKPLTYPIKHKNISFEVATLAHFEQDFGSVKNLKRLLYCTNPVDSKQTELLIDCIQNITIGRTRDHYRTNEGMMPVIGYSMKIYIEKKSKFLSEYLLMHVLRSFFSYIISVNEVISVSFIDINSKELLFESKNWSNGEKINV